MTKMIQQYNGIDLDKLEMMYCVYLEYKSKGIDLSEITNAFMDGVAYQKSYQEKYFEQMTKSLLNE